MREHLLGVGGDAAGIESFVKGMATDPGNVGTQLAGQVPGSVGTTSDSKDTALSVSRQDEMREGPKCERDRNARGTGSGGMR